MRQCLACTEPRHAVTAHDWTTSTNNWHTYLARYQCVNTTVALMPTSPPRVCNRCHKPAPKGQPCTCRPAYEGSTHPSGNDRRWQGIRRAKLQANPICEHPGCRRPATDVDHITPLAEGGERYEWRNLQTLCPPHHTVKTTQDAQRGKTRAR